MGVVQFNVIVDVRTSVVQFNVVVDVTGVALVIKPLLGRRTGANARRMTSRYVKFNLQRTTYTRNGLAFNMRRDRRWSFVKNHQEGA